MRKRKSFNPKRKILRCEDRDLLTRLAQKVSYGGNPEHKRAPGDFALMPPTRPHPDKTLCDGVAIFEHYRAAELLRNGILKGLISEQFRNGYPQNVWSVTENDEALEAQLENPEQGIYHGYPMPSSDPMRKIILRHWGKK